MIVEKKRKNSVIFCIFFFTLPLFCCEQLSVTEQANQASCNLDTLSAFEIVQLMNAEDQSVAYAVTPYLSNIARAVDVIVSCIENGGRLY